jgi:dynein light chain roadblock-type
LPAAAPRAPSSPSADASSPLDHQTTRRHTRQGVVGYVLCASSGPDGAAPATVVGTTLAPGLARAYASAAPALGRAARAAVRDLDPRDDLAFMRLRTARHELAVAAS